MNLIHNEQIKLFANYLNGLAIALFALGALQPLLTDAFSSPFTAIRVGICLIVSILLHVLGQGILGNLKP
jgi:VIT1/CCC1 family predicted Fe2+/Mn2+ transporter